MVQAKNVNPGMTLSLQGRLYRVDSSVKVSVPKGASFIKVKLRDLVSNELIEKNFQADQVVNDVALTERTLEYLYKEGKDHLFLDIGQLVEVMVPQTVIGDKVLFLKEGVQLHASLYGETVFAVELPQFLELMIGKMKGEESKRVSRETKLAVLETGAEIEVPPFIEVGDIIKVDTKTSEYVQRV